MPSRLTRGLVAERLERQVPEAVRLRALAASTDEAVFSGQEIDDQATDVVWTEALAAVEIARAGLSRGRRWLSRYRIRSARDWVARERRTRADRTR